MYGLIESMFVDIVIPHRNEHEYIEMAKRLGIDGLVFVGKKVKTDFKIFYVNVKESTGNDRGLIERGGFDVLYNVEAKQKKDFMHQRGSGLNHILCKLMVKKGICLGFNFSKVLGSSPVTRGKILGKMKQNFKLCKKYGVPTLIASFARSPYQMRSAHDLRITFESFGMPKDMAKKSIEYLGKKVWTG